MINLKFKAGILPLLVALGAWLLISNTPVPDSEANWANWRGPSMTGAYPDGNPPIDWTADKNVRWKVKVPGIGNSSPVIWQDRILITTAIPAEKVDTPADDESDESGQGRGRRGIQVERMQSFTILAINRKNGSVIWQKELARHAPHEGTHQDGTWASNSPITDGEHILVCFGSNGIYCLDMNGELVWKKDLGKMQTRRSFGEGSSPALSGNTLVVNWDHEGASFIVALDKRSGEELWRRDRDEPTSWATPLIVNVDGADQVIVAATNRTRSYDLESGDVIWEASGMTTNTIPSPVYADGIVYVMSGFRGNMLQAIRLSGATGDITGTESIVWQYDRDTPYVPSPLLYGKYLYVVKHNKGILSCFDSKTGEKFYGPERLEGLEGIYASPVGASNRVYFASLDGSCLVIENGPEFKVLARMDMNDRFFASPAIAGDELYLRGRNLLYCIAENE